MSAARSFGAAALVLLVGALASPLAAQEDEITPPGHAPGAPAGSYALSDFDNINLFNGNLNFRLPLLSVGGRGEAGYTVMLPIEQHWGIEHNDTLEAFPRFNWWRDYRPGYGPGVLTAYRSTEEGFLGLTRLTFTGPDGTQHEFRDDVTEGQARAVNPPFNRGRIFRTHDGSQLTFVSDVDVLDTGAIGPDGLLMFPDGTRYRIDGAIVSWIQDRNGNVVRFEYAAHKELGPQVAVVTDSLHRVVEFDYHEIPSNPPVRYDTIDFRGWGGSSRQIRIDYALLEGRLAEGGVLRLDQLLPLMNWGPTVGAQVHNPWVVSQVSLPNGRSYRFLYNAYGELAEVELPTGGKYRYAYAPGVSNPDDGGGTVGGGTAIYRRLTQKSVYGDGGEEMRMTMGPEDYQGVTYPDVRINVEHRLPQDNSVIAQERHYFRGRAVNNLISSAQAYPWWDTGLEYKTEILDPSDRVLRTINRVWQQAAPVSWAHPGQNPANEPRVTSEATVLENGQQALVTHEYTTVTRLSQQYDNLRDTWEYGFDGGPVRRRHLDYVTSPAYVGDNVHLRRLVSREETYEVVGGTPVVRARTSYDYDSHPEGLVPRSSLSGRLGPPDTHGTGFTLRGNVTGVRRFLDTTGGELLTRRRYDVAGNVVKETNPKNHSTVFDYADNFGVPDGGTSDHVPPGDLDGFSAFAFVSQTINPLLHATRTQTDYHLGRPVDVKDPSDVVTSFWFEDDLDRLTRIIQANSPGHQDARTRKGFTYDDEARVVTTVADKNAFNDQAYKTDVVYDALGREVLSRTYEGASVVALSKGYDARGRLAAVSNPYRPGEAVHWTVTYFDALGRQVVQQLPDATYVLTSYSGSSVTVTDQASQVRRSVSDALGRVVTLVEDPPETGGTLNYQTSYLYDALDNLRTVTQGGQTRTFGFDSLSRMTFQTTPEAGTTTFAYDDNGNLVKRTDGRNVVTCWGNLAGSTCDNTGYDALDRPMRKSYSDGTPQVNYGYDSGAVPFARGRLVSVSSSVSTTAISSYDPLGRVTGSTQTTGGVSYTSFYGYDRSGLLTSQAYPTGRVVYTNRDLVGRVSQVVEAGRLFAGSFQYHAHGAPSQRMLGNGRWETAIFNERLQPRYLGLGSAPGVRDLLQIENRYVDPAPAPNRNNGNVLKQIIAMPGASFVQDFTYDAANRLKTAVEGSAWSQTYTYDRFGNRATTGTRPNPEQTPTQLGHFAANNRLNTAFDPDILYDNGGNLTRDAQARGMSYDAENRQTSVGSTTYAYDGEGRRVRKMVGGLTTTFVYDAYGKLVAEYGSAMIPQPVYLTKDHLGSTRLATDGAGNVVGRWDYLPFGEEIPTSYGGRGTIGGYGSDPGVRQKHTGKERDIETGLDYFEARYESAAQGRFQSADPIAESGNHVADPQEWNRYAYVRNNPLRLVDPDGRAGKDMTGAQVAQLQQRALAAGPRSAGFVLDTLLPAAGLAVTLGPAAMLVAETAGPALLVEGSILLGTPRGQQLLSGVAEAVSPVPLGFAGAADFAHFGKALASGLEAAGEQGAKAFLAGSAVSGSSFRTGAAFDVGRVSDFDVALVGKNLLDKAAESGVGLRGQGTRTGPLRASELQRLGLAQLQAQLSRLAGRPVKFMIYESEAVLKARGQPVRAF